MIMIPGNHHRGTRWVLGLLDLLILIILASLPVVWLMRGMPVHIGGVSVVWHSARPLALVWLILVAIRSGWGINVSRSLGRDHSIGLWRFKPYPQLMLALFSSLLFFGCLESFLAWRGFAANLPPVIFEGRDEEGGRVIPHTLPDPELLWKFKPGSEFHGRTINQLGFRSREIKAKKAANTMRIMCMGDSVTAQGRPDYAEYLHRQLQEQPPTSHAWEAFNVGVHGYCILQGLVQFKRLDPMLTPDIVTIYFGWNDHWLDAKPMSQQMAVRMGSISGRLYEALRKSRLFCLMIVALNPSKPLLRNQTNDWVPRVPPDQYRQALTELVRAIQASGAIPVVITAPRRGLTEELLRKKYARSIEEAERTHDAYVDIAREVARESNAELFDLAKVLEGPENDALFAPDGIHFDFYQYEGRMTEDPPAQPGLERIGRELYLFISNEVAGIIR